MNKSIKITQIQELDANELLKQFQDLHAELLAIKENISNSKKADILLTRKQTAEILQISLVTLWNWTKGNTLTAHRIGNQVRYKKSEVLNALQEIKPKNANNANG
ncbi:conserved hypothetical protein [Tenacibaculum maritimum]|uniref:helix-turn-helix domain-containing protein n=1 Tax=Tenacibaculum maritimum TaxID=107401 RepID=UPI0012E58E7F|nr:helix-turn-helix domain-containing protein [Tenacibaculum maritimum]CAA0159645.1 conserved hypothetical protein [Tenacibaculum maritimum]CAA0230909.1 conserved hypothetical protein [Tenacibaculum maritimum]